MSKLEKISILMAAYNSPSKLEGVSRSDEGVFEFDAFIFICNIFGVPHQLYQ